MFKELGCPDLNWIYNSQSIMCYHYTTAHYMQLFCLMGKLPTQQKEVMKNIVSELECS
nr:MAG TPA: hypothetical protein [Caudoviricetes sp.]